MSSNYKMPPEILYDVCMEYAKGQSAKDSAGDYRKGLHDGVVMALRDLGLITDEQKTAYGRAKEAAKLIAGAGQADA